MPDSSSELIQYADDVWRIAIRLLSDEDDARECYQQTFLDALRVKSGTVKNWQAVLCRIATRRAMDALRRRYRNREFSSLETVDVVQNLSPEHPVVLQELRESVRQILARLPESQAEAFYLRHIEQWEPAQIAQQLGIESGHVRVLIHRTLAVLRNTLPSCFQPDDFQIAATQKSDGAS